MTDPFVASGERAISFGPFRLLPDSRLLLEGDNPMRIGSRAFDILNLLVEHPGELVGKDELMARVWPNTHVEESNLKFQVSALRRTLGGGNRYLINVPGRGYSFIAPVTRSESPMPSALQAADEKRVHNLPAHLTRIIGRADIVSRLAGQLPRQRFLTVVGPGGIGKTTVALAVAEALIPAYEHGVRLIDLAPLGDPRLVPTALAAALGLEIRSENPLPGLIAFLRDKRMLLVFDNCAHVIDAAAALAIAVLRNAPGVHILATSREPLRIEGEHVHRLSPLASPPASARLTAAEALRFPAVQLFVERAAETLDEFKLSDADASLVSDICNKLDGIALAIELAAARVDAFGVRGVAAHLDDRFRLLTKGRRTALPRHRTLSATLDWSYGLLTEFEQTVLRRLAVFARGFTLQAAGTIVADATHPESEIVDLVAELVVKSLVTADAGDAEPRLRLLETTRAYALEKLVESGERDRLARRHAEYYRDLLATAAQDGAAAEDWPAAYAPEIDNIRAALEYAFAPGGDAAVGVAIAADSAPIWLDLCLLSECHVWEEKAVANLDTAGRGTRREMVLLATLGTSLRFTTGITEEAHAGLTRALELAERFNELDYQLRTLHVLFTYHAWRGELSAALTFARRCEAFAAGVTDPSAPPAADRMLGISQFFLGNLASARSHLQRALAGFPAASRHTDLLRFGLDRRVNVLAYMSNVLWLQGSPDQALQMARASACEARSLGHPVSLCAALVWGTRVLIWVGDVDAADRWAEELNDQAEKHSLDTYRPFSAGFKGQLAAKRGDVMTAVQLLRGAIEGSAGGSLGYYACYTAFATDLALAEAEAGRLDRNLPVIDDALQHVARTEESVYLPEMLRVEGEILLMQDKSKAAVAETDFLRSLDLARRQGALSWELRTAMSLARLKRDGGRRGEARDLLTSVYGRFTEGFATPDLRAAKRLLDELT